MKRIAHMFVLAIVFLLAALSPARAGRRISSDASTPDTARAAALEPEARVAMARLPVWVALDEHLAAGRSSWDNAERGGSRLRESFSLYLPAVRPHWRSWVSIGYEQEQLLVPATLVTFDSLGHPQYGPITQRVPASYLSMRIGVDRTHGPEARPWGFAGAGIGVGHGQYAAPWRSPQFEWSGVEATARAGFYLYPWRAARLGVHASGVMGWRRASEYDVGVLSEVRLGLSVEAPLELPKRFVSAD